MTGYVYAMETDAAYKFGYSTNPWRRISHVRRGVDIEVRMRGFVKGTRDQEMRLHELLKRHSVGGEWYRRDTVTNQVAALFPHQTRPNVLRLVETSYDGDKSEFVELLRAVMHENEPILIGLERIADETGITFRRLKSLWYGESVRVSRSDFDRMRAMALRVRRALGGGAP